MSAPPTSALAARRSLLLLGEEDALAAALLAHEASGLTSLFGEVGVAPARGLPLEAVGGEAVTVLRAADRPCLPIDAAARALDGAARLLLSGTAQAVRLRGGEPSGDPSASAYRRWHGPGPLPALRRRLRPHAARRAAGGAALTEPRADRRHRGLIDRADDEEGTYLVCASAIAWPDAPVMLDRAAASRRIAARGSIERDWHASGWTVAVPRGIFVGPEATTDRPRA